MNNTENYISKWLTFTFSKEIYAVNLRHVQEIIPYTEPSLVPGAPDHVLGIINLREQAITVMNGQTILGLQHTEWGEQKRIIILECFHQVQGVLVNTVSEIIDIEESNISKSIKTHIDDDDHKVIDGTYERDGTLYILVSVTQLMASEIQ
jgi:purine-binding chemotaxis protein CheW